MFRDTSTGMRRLAFLIAFAVVGWSGIASAQLVRPLGLEDLVQGSDAVIVANCVEKKTSVKNGNIVTSYKLKVQEQWKGSVTLSSAGELEFEELGGFIPKLGLTQHVGGMANLTEGEDVLLFAHVPAPQSAAPALQGVPEGTQPTISPSSIRIVGRQQGRFTVVRHPETGAQMVSPVAVQSMPGSVRSPLLNKLQELETRPTLSAAQSADQATTGLLQGARPVDPGADRVRSRLASRIEQHQRRLEQLEEVEGLELGGQAIRPFESLDSVRERVKKVAANQARAGKPDRGARP